MDHPGKHSLLAHHREGNGCKKSAKGELYPNIAHKKEFGQNLTDKTHRGYLS
jgi:hypothetical protein